MTGIAYTIVSCDSRYSTIRAKRKTTFRPVSDGVLHVPNLIDKLGTAEERRMNELSTAKSGTTKVRRKFGKACRITRRWSDIDSYTAPFMCQN